MKLAVFAIWMVGHDEFEYVIADSGLAMAVLRTARLGRSDTP